MALIGNSFFIKLKKFALNYKNLFKVLNFLLFGFLSRKLKAHEKCQAECNADESRAAYANNQQEISGDISDDWDYDHTDKASIWQSIYDDYKEDIGSVIEQASLRSAHANNMNAFATESDSHSGIVMTPAELFSKKFCSFSVSGASPEGELQSLPGSRSSAASLPPYCNPQTKSGAFLSTAADTTDGLASAESVNDGVVYGHARSSSGIGTSVANSVASRALTRQFSSYEPSVASRRSNVFASGIHVNRYATPEEAKRESIIAIASNKSLKTECNQSMIALLNAIDDVSDADELDEILKEGIVTKSCLLDQEGKLHKNVVLEIERLHATFVPFNKRPGQNDASSYTSTAGTEQSLAGSVASTNNYEDASSDGDINLFVEGRSHILFTIGVCLAQAILRPDKFGCTPTEVLRAISDYITDNHCFTNHQCDSGTLAVSLYSAWSIVKHIGRKKLAELTKDDKFMHEVDRFMNLNPNIRALHISMLEGIVSNSHDKTSPDTNNSVTEKTFGPIHCTAIALEHCTRNINQALADDRKHLIEHLSKAQDATGDSLYNNSVQASALGLVQNVAPYVQKCPEVIALMLRRCFERMSIASQNKAAADPEYVRLLDSMSAVDKDCAAMLHNSLELDASYHILYTAILHLFLKGELPVSGNKYSDLNTYHIVRQLLTDNQDLANIATMAVKTTYHYDADTKQCPNYLKDTTLLGKANSLYSACWHSVLQYKDVAAWQSEKNSAILTEEAMYVAGTIKRMMDGWEICDNEWDQEIILRVFVSAVMSGKQEVLAAIGTLLEVPCNESDILAKITNCEMFLPALFKIPASHATLTNSLSQLTQKLRNSANNEHWANLHKNKINDVVRDSGIAIKKVISMQIPYENVCSDAINTLKNVLDNLAMPMHRPLMHDLTAIISGSSIPYAENDSIAFDGACAMSILNKIQSSPALYATFKRMLTSTGNTTDSKKYSYCLFEMAYKAYHATMRPDDITLANICHIMDDPDFFTTKSTIEPYVYLRSICEHSNAKDDAMQTLYCAMLSFVFLAKVCDKPMAACYISKLYMTIMPDVVYNTKQSLSDCAVQIIEHCLNDCRIPDNYAIINDIHSLIRDCFGSCSGKVSKAWNDKIIDNNDHVVYSAPNSSIQDIQRSQSPLYVNV